MVYYICPKCQNRSPTYDESMQHYTDCEVIRPANIDALGRPIVPPTLTSTADDKGGDKKEETGAIKVDPDKP